MALTRSGTTLQREVDEVLDEPCFEEIVARWFEPVYGYLARRVGSELARDLAADVFVRAYRERHRYDPARGSEAAWLFTLAHGVLAKNRRAEARRLRALGRLAATGRPGELDQKDQGDRVVEQIHARAELAVVARALRQMSARKRDALYLVALVSLSYEDASVVLAVPIGTVRSRVSRARSELRAALGAGEQRAVSGADGAGAPGAEGGGSDG